MTTAHRLCSSNLFHRSVNAPLLHHIEKVNRKGLYASQIKSIYSYPVPLLSAKSVSLYFYGKISRGPSKEARPLGKLLLSLLPVDAKLSIGLSSSFYCASIELFVSAFIVVELAGIPFFYLALNMLPFFHLH